MYGIFNMHLFLQAHLLKWNTRDCQSNESWVMTQSWLLRVLTIWAQITVTGSFVREYCEHRLFVGCLMQIDPRTAVHLWSKNEWEFPQSLLRNEWELPQSLLRNEWSKESLWTHPMTQLCLTTGVRVSQVMKKSWRGHDSWPILPFLTITTDDLMNTVHVLSTGRSSSTL